MAENLIQPGYVEFERLILSSPGSNQTIDITPIVDEFSIYENVMQPFMSASLYISDATSLFTLFPLTGDETLDISLKIPLPSFPNSYSIIMRVTGIQDISSVAQVRQVRYVLRCHAQEAFKDWTSRIRKSYSNMPVSQMVTKLAEEFLGIDGLTASESSGNRTIVIPNMTPSRALKFLSKEAKSEKYAPSNFVFYSDTNGYYWKTLDELMEKNPTDKYFMTEKNYFPNADLSCPAPGIVGSFRDNNLLDSLNSGDASTGKPFEFMKVIDYEFKNTFDLETQLTSGVFDNTIMSLDPQAKVFKKKVYNYISDYAKFQKTDKKAAKLIYDSSDLASLKGGSSHRFLLTDSSHNKETPDNKEDFLGYMQASGALINYIALSLTIPGDTTRHVGDIIRIGFPEFSSFDETIGEENAFLSGDYLVTGIRHMWNRKIGFRSVMACAKNCYNKSPQEAKKNMTDFNQGLTIGGVNPTLTRPL